VAASHRLLPACVRAHTGASVALKENNEKICRFCNELPTSPSDARYCTALTTRGYNECVNNQADGLFRFAVKTLKQQMLAEDIVQVAFARLWEKKDTVQAAKAKGYLFQTCSPC
jgi:hypothetical protein